jgi:hypothetical protein
MSETFFILTTLFVAYVVYLVKDDSTNKTSPTPNAPPRMVTEPTIPVAEVPTVAETVAETVVETAEIVTPLETVSEPKTAEESVEHLSVAQIEQEAEIIHATTAHILKLRNPKTGEITKVPHSYPFAKRWIKEALVAEGLLEKMYSNHELNPRVNAQTKKALATLKTMVKYQQV